MTAVDISGPAIPRLSRRQLASFVRRSLVQLGKAGAVAGSLSEVSIAFVSDRQMTLVNKRYRGKRTTTDVLTFPASLEDTAPGATSRPLGEIVISIDQARRQAKQERHALAIEIRYLVLHGIIHALGFDHESDRGEMDALELEIRREVGLE